jgi:hypothetical protein
MRAVYSLLGLVRRFGAARVEVACEAALRADMLSVRRLQRMIELAVPSDTPAPTRAQAPPARYLRPAQQYAIPGLGPASEPKETT